MIWALLLALGPMAAAQDDDPTLRLAIGDPKFKDKTLDIQAGQIVSAALGRRVSWESMAEDLGRVRFVYIGETHKSLPNLAVNGKAYSDINELRLDLAVFTWGQEVKFKLLRGCEVREVILRIIPPPAKGGPAGRPPEDRAGLK